MIDNSSRHKLLLPHSMSALKPALAGVLLMSLVMPAGAAEVPFAAAQAIDSDFEGAISLAAADLDGDGTEEVVGAATVGGDISIWTNTAGDGSTWTETLVEGDFPGARSLSLANMDRRFGGSVDILAVSDDIIRVWRNTSSDGSVWTPADVSTAATFPNPIFAVPAEIDGIGSLDVVGVSASGVSWWFNNFGIGQIWNKNDIELTGGGASSAAVADIDRDGDTDVLVTFFDGDEVVWYDNTAGDGSAWTRRSVATQFDGAQAVTAADLDGDGDLDIAGAASLGDTLAWWENTMGDGSAWTEHVVDATVDEASSVVAQDVEGDGDLDLLVAASGSGELRWYDNTAGDGSAWTARDLPGTLLGAASAVTLDVDDDGDQDVLGAGLDADEIAWWENRSIHRSAAYPVKAAVDTSLGNVRSVFAADVDGDGDEDLLAALQDAGDVLWWENTAGDGSAWTEHTIDADYAGVSGVTAGDLDGDGDLDVYATSSTQNNGVWWANIDGDGSSWGPASQIFSGNFDPSHPQIVDIDEDGTLDVMAVMTGSFRITFWRNLNGLGTNWFQSIAQGNYREARSAHATDIDGDGDADIATVASFVNTVSFVRNGLSLGYQVNVIDTTFTDAFSTFAADLDDDGDVDILAASRSTGEIAWWENTTSNGDFGARQTLATGLVGVTQVRAADLDGDGDVDVYATSSTSNELVWFENSGDGSSWDRHQVEDALSQAGPAYAADPNGDGRLDLVAGGAGGELSWWSNLGGEFALPTTDVAPSIVGDGGSVAVLRIDAAHRGRVGDTAVELATVEVLLESAPGVPMTEPEADALLAELSLFADDGSGSFEPASDTEIASLDSFSLDAGVATLVVADDQAQAQIAFGTAPSYFVVPTFEATASSTLFDAFRFTHVTEASSSGEDAANDLPLTLEYSANVSTQTIGFNAAPTAQDDAVFPNEDQSLSSNVLDGSAGGLDSDSNGDSLTAMLVDPPTHGILVGGLASNGDFQYQPAADFNGVDTFTYRADDGLDLSDIATVTLTVAPVNDPPSFGITAQHVSSEDAAGQVVPGFAFGITPGPADEAGQAVMFSIAGNTHPGLFATPPAIAPDGTLTYTAAADAIGTAQITVRLSDDGGTAGGGVDQSPEQSFDLVVDAVNDPPSFTLAFTQDTSDEDAGPQSVAGFATDILAGPSDEVSQAVSFSVTGNTDPSLFSSAPALAPDGTLTYTAAPDANGSARITVRLADDGGTAGGGIDQSPEQSFDLVIDAVNDAPSFTLAFTQDTSGEDAGPQSVAGFATDILAGPGNESSQTLSFAVTGNTDPSLFSVAPALALDGTLTYTAAPDTTGTAQITVRLSDDGGTAGGGVDQSSEQSFDLVIDAVNDAPSFTLAFTQDTSSEDAGPQSVAGFATDILAGPSDEASQTLSFSVTGNTDPSLFSSAPALAPDGTLTYTAAPDANGSASITVRLTDDGGTAGGGVDQSPEQSFDLVIDAVNDAPSFTLAFTQDASSEDAGPRSVVGFATAILAGPSDEASQTLSFAVTGNTDPSLFSVAPTLAPDGTLTYTAAPDTVGTAQITVRLSDDGGTANGGIDQSPQQSFDIVVDAVNDPPSFTLAFTQDTSGEDAGPQSVAGFAADILAGPDDEARQNVSFSVTGNTDPSLFSSAPALAPDGTLTYTAAPDANGSASITVRLTDDGGTAGGGIDQSPEQSFDLVIDAINDAPSFTLALAQTTSSEDAGPQSVVGFAADVLAGPSDEASQVLSFWVTGNTDPSLFSAPPVLAADGTLTYTAVADAIGTAQITVRLSDDGGTAGGGIDQSPEQSFDIRVTTINDPPTFSLTPLASSLEDAGAQTVADFATSIRPGPDDEARQTVHFVVTELSNPALFETAPELSADGTLTYTSAPDANGTSTVSVVLRDDGGTAGGGMDQSAEQSFDIEITAVNDSPSFEVPEVLQVEPDSTPQIVIDFATELSAGPADEAGQALQFQILSNSNPGLFAADPELSPDGTLSFTLVPGASGDSAILEAILMDDGGTDLGGSDTSQTSDFTLVVPDAVAPQITSISSPFGPLETCSESRQAFGRIGVDFSEAMAFAGDPSEPSSVLNPDNYQLIASGVDQDVTTTACGSLDGDDQRVFPSAVIPAAVGANEVSVELPGVLRDGLYKLLVCDALADASGNPLAETFEVAFRVSGENGFANGQVDCDLEAWQIATGSVEGMEEVTYSEQDADDSSLSGSIGILSLQNTDFALGQCVDWVSSAYDLAARVRVEGASEVEVEVVLHCERFSQSGCVGASLGDSSSQFSLSPTGGTWQPLEHASEGGQSALCGVDLRLLTGDGFEAFVDGLFVATQLFADGFESGNTGAWSNTVP